MVELRSGYVFEPHTSVISHPEQGIRTPINWAISKAKYLLVKEIKNCLRSKRMPWTLDPIRRSPSRSPYAFALAFRTLSRTSKRTAAFARQDA